MKNLHQRSDRSPFTPRGRGYSMRAKADETEVFLYDEIGFFGIQAEDFIKDFNAINTKTINLRINSPGGSVFDGSAIFNAIQRHKSKVITHVDGIAASMASVIALAGDEVRIANNGFIMIHDPWSIAIGPAETMRKEADVLDKIGETIAKTYADKTGKSLDEIKALMSDETWFNAQEAKDIGLVDAVEEGSEAKSHFDLSIFNRVPDHLKNLSCETPDKRTLEAALRDAGCSRKQATAILSGGYEEIDQRDADAEALKTLAGTIDAVTNRIKALIPA